MNVELAILQRARALIEPFECWTQGHLARSKGYWGVSVQNPNACRFCAAGAIKRAAFDLGYGSCERAMVLLNQVAQSIGWVATGVVGFNDRQPHTPTGHAAVLALFDEAIELAKEVSDE